MGLHVSSLRVCFIFVPVLCCAVLCCVYSSLAVRCGAVRAGPVYEIPSALGQSPAASMGSGHKDIFSKEGSKIPGPGSYQVPASALADKPFHMLGGKGHAPSLIPSPSPGPVYDIPSTIGKKYPPRKSLALGSPGSPGSPGAGAGGKAKVPSSHAAAALAPASPQRSMEQ